MANKLALSRVLTALDKKDYGFFDRLTEDEQKEIQPYVLLRYIAFVKGSTDLREWYMRAANEFVNKGFWDVSAKHKKLLWNMLCDVSPNMGNQYHEWVPMKKESKNKKRATLSELYPNAGEMELDTLNVIYKDDELKQELKDRGWDAKAIRNAI